MKNCSDTCKAFSSVALVTLNVIQLGSGIFMYFNGYKVIDQFNINGGKFLPAFNINFNSFSLYVFYSLIASALVLGFGLTAAQVKKPFTALAFLIMGSGAALMMVSTASIAFRFDHFTHNICLQEHLMVSSHKSYYVIAEMQREYQNLVDGFMCTTSCPCYEGENGEIKAKWQKYGDELTKFGRNSGKTNTKVNGVQTFALFGNGFWSDDIANSYTTYQDCYNKVLKPQKKYEAISTYKNYAADFFKPEGAFEFQIQLERQARNCAGLCKIHMFSISGSIADGIQKEECMGKALTLSHIDAQNVGWQLIVTALIIIMNLICVFGVCTGYNTQGSSVLAMTKEGMQELGIVTDNEEPDVLNLKEDEE